MKWRKLPQHGHKIILSLQVRLKVGKQSIFSICFYQKYFQIGFHDHSRAQWGHKNDSLKEKGFNHLLQIQIFLTSQLPDGSSSLLQNASNLTCYLFYRDATKINEKMFIIS